MSAPSPSPRLAVIGCGSVVVHHLAPALRRIGWMPGVLIDPSDRSLERAAARLGRKLGRFATGPDAAALLDRFDAAIVAAPHAAHGPIGKALLAAGKHVFVEKPLATDAADCHALIAAAARDNLVLSVGLLRRYLHVAQWLKALLESGRLGQIHSFDAREGFIFNWATSTLSLLQRESAGGGVLMDTGAHTLDLLQWWFGDVDSLAYEDDSQGGVEANCRLELAFASGAEGVVELSRLRNLQNTIRIEGTSGFVEVHLYRNQVIDASPGVRSFVHGRIGLDNMPKQLFAQLFDAELADFRTSVGGGPRRGVPGWEGARAVELIERCYAARRPMRMPWERARPAPLPAAVPPTAPAVSAIGPDRLIVITGASGFIGGRLAERLVREHGARVRCLVRNLAKSARLARLPVEIVPIDLADGPAVKSALDGADLIFHCAYDSVSRRQNLVGTRNLITAAGQGSGVSRLVHVSTFSVYEPFRDGDLTEDTPDGDRSWMYVRSKLDLEHDVLTAARSGECPATVIQPAIVYGPFGTSWTNAPAEMLLHGTVILPDSGDGLCNCVYVDDLVDALLLAAVRDEAIGERFVISGPEQITWEGFFGHFARTLGAPPPIFWPAARITAAQRDIMRDVRMVLNDPKKIMQLIVRWDVARRVLQAGLDAMPRPMHDLVVKYYFERQRHPLRRQHIPDKQFLGLYTAKPIVRCDKAHRLLGYQPRFGLDAGMAATMAYVQWAFGNGRAEGIPPPTRKASPPVPDAPGLADAS